MYFYFSLEFTSTNINWYVTLLFIAKEEVFSYRDFIASFKDVPTYFTVSTDIKKY
jgi:hypothetical protein